MEKELLNKYFSDEHKEEDADEHNRIKDEAISLFPILGKRLHSPCLNLFHASARKGAGRQGSIILPYAHHPLDSPQPLIDCNDEEVDAPSTLKKVAEEIKAASVEMWQNNCNKDNRPLKLEIHVRNEGTIPDSKKNLLRHRLESKEISYSLEMPETIEHVMDMYRTIAAFVECKNDMIIAGSVKGVGKKAFVFQAVSCAIQNVFAAEDRYTTKYDSINIDEILDNKRLLQGYIKCLMETGKCNEEGQTLKEVIPDALITACKKCSETQQKSIEK
ncbi:hypothetical protein ILUMI_00408, partial [Ignelater luminosus]